MHASNRLVSAGVLALALMPALAAAGESVKGKYGFGVSLTAARMTEETFSGTVNTASVFDEKTIIPDFHFKFRGWKWSEVEVAPVVGFTAASFSGQTFTDSRGVAVAPDDIEASAFYGGVRLGAEPQSWNGWGVAVELDLGVSSLSDVDGHEANIGTTERFYDGGSSGYGAFGLFGTYTFGMGDGEGHAFIGIRGRSFGTLEGQTTPLGGLIVNDLDLGAGGWEFGFGYRW